MSFKSVTAEEAKQIAAKLYRYDQLAGGRVANLKDIGEQELQFYKQEGYLIVEQLLTEDEIGIAQKEISDIIIGQIKGPLIQYVSKAKEDWTAEEREAAIRKINNYGEYAQGLGKITKHEGMLSLLERLLGEKAESIINQALLKPPFGGGEKPWHQDMAYGNQQYTKQTITVWIALDEADKDNGCMHIIPRSHQYGGVPHYQVRDWQICDTAVDTLRDRIVPLKPGGALLFSGLLHHGTPANLSPKRRRALQLRYAPSSAKLMDKEQYKLVFTNEMTELEC